MTYKIFAWLVAAAPILSATGAASGGADLPKYYRDLGNRENIQGTGRCRTATSLALWVARA